MSTAVRAPVSFRITAPQEISHGPRITCPITCPITRPITRSRRASLPSSPIARRTAQTGTESQQVESTECGCMPVINEHNLAIAAGALR